MSDSSAIPALNGRTTLGVPIEKAFGVFTDSFNTWWPREFHIGQAEMAEAILEPREGGRWYELGVDGIECDWGRVLAWEPPHRLLITWQINGEWQYDPDPHHASEIEVRFIAEGPKQTRVEQDVAAVKEPGVSEDRRGPDRGSPKHRSWMHCRARRMAMT